MTTAARRPGSASRSHGSSAGSSTMTTAGSAWRRMASRMSGGVSEARGTSTAPRKWMARLHTIHSGRLSLMSATSSPRLTPSFCARASASTLARRSSSS